MQWREKRELTTERCNKTLPTTHHLHLQENLLIQNMLTVTADTALWQQANLRNRTPLSPEIDRSQQICKALFKWIIIVYQAFILFYWIPFFSEFNNSLKKSFVFCNFLNEDNLYDLNYCSHLGCYYYITFLHLFWLGNLYWILNRTFYLIHCCSFLAIPLSMNK